LLTVPVEWLREFQSADGFIPNFQNLIRRLDSTVLRAIPRTRAENDPRFKQLVGYVIFRCGDEVFHYQRSPRVGEPRLANLRSLGVGGHVNARDLKAGSVPDTLAAAIRREIAEEVSLVTPATELVPRYLGLIDSEDSSVSQVHLGIVAIAELSTPHLTLRDGTLVDARFDSPASLLRNRAHEFETWSQMCLRFLVDHTPIQPESF